MVRLRSVGVLSVGKIFGVLYGGIAILLIPIFLAMAAIMPMAQTTDQKTPSAIVFVVMAFVLPFIYGLMGFIFGCLGALVYNLAAGWLGGIEMHFETVAPAPAFAPQPTPPPAM